jgi:multidrug resistance protein, MATE family
MLQLSPDKSTTAPPAGPTRTREVFAIAGPAMLANLTTPLLGVVATAAIGRLGDAALLGGVAMATVIFDCLFWLFGFLRMGTLAFTAQAQGAGDRDDFPVLLARALLLAGATGVLLIVLQVPLANVLFGAMGGSEGATRAAQAYFAVRIWSAPLVFANYVILGWLVGQARAVLALAIQVTIDIAGMVLTLALVLALDWGIAGAAAASIVAEACGLILGLAIARRLLGGRFAVPAAALFDRARFLHMMAVNRDIMIRTAALIVALLFFVSQGARAGDVTLAANAVLNNLLLVSSFFLDGLANAAEQLCGQAYGARNRKAFASATRLVLAWGFAFAIGVALVYALFGTTLIDAMTASDDVRRIARDFLVFAVIAPLPGVFAFAFDGVFIGATWSRDMRNLMLLSLLTYVAAWFVLQPFGNAGLWGALIAFYVARGGLQGLRYPALLRKSFKENP